MDNTEIVNAVLSARDSHSDAFECVLPEMKALEARRVRTVNVEPSTAVSRVLAAAPRVLALREDVERIFRDYDFARLEKLELYACALQHAHACYLSSRRTPAELRALASEGDALRTLLMSIARPLVTQGLIDGARIESCQRQRGYRTIATDLGVLATVLLSYWAKIKDKCCISKPELERAKEMSMALLEFAGKRDVSPRSQEAARDLRNRAFTLLATNYDEARRVVSYVRWHDGDLEKIAPSLSGGRTRHSRKPAPEEQAESPSGEAHDNTDSVPGTSSATPNLRDSAGSAVPASQQA